MTGETLILNSVIAEFFNGFVFESQLKEIYNVDPLDNNS